MSAICFHNADECYDGRPLWCGTCGKLATGITLVEGGEIMVDFSSQELNLLEFCRVERNVFGANGNLLTVRQHGTAGQYTLGDSGSGGGGEGEFDNVFQLRLD